MVTSSDSGTTPLLQPYALKSRATRTQWVEDALSLIRSGKQAALSQIILMLDDLHRNGRNCQYIKSLAGLPLYELKPNSRGGHKGGARVYFHFTEHDEALILATEVKSQGVSAPNPAKIEKALRMLVAFKKNELKIARNTTSLNPQWW